MGAHTKITYPVILLASFLMASASSARSYDSYNKLANGNVSRETSFITHPLTPPSSVVAMCKSLLQPNHHAASPTADKNQRTAGKITALGIILGARFALEPQKENTNINAPQETIPRHGTQTESTYRTAFSIAAFRKCQKEHVLTNLAHIK